MPSGATHDRITIMGLPLVGGIALLATHSPSIALTMASSFLFSGLMFGPDLDIYSVQYKRWGLFRWIWRPYQNAIRHRSWLSHGPIVGTAIRLLYLGSWVAVLGGIVLGIAIANRHPIGQWETFVTGAKQSILQYAGEFTALLVGLELGALSHSLSDHIGSAWKKWRKGKRSPQSRKTRR
ncbi:MAG: metal-binding protein [Thermosynechococcaceae cyanobacterium]